eukprot:830007_1
MVRGMRIRRMCRDSAFKDRARYNQWKQRHQKETIEYPEYLIDIRNDNQQTQDEHQQTKIKFNEISKRIQTNDSLALIVENTEAMARLCGHDLHSLDDLDLEFMKRKYIVFINKMLIALMTASKAAKGPHGIIE